MVGQTALGKYRLLQTLGSGSNAEVFLATPLHAPDTYVVVKRIHDHVVAHARFRQLFEAEVRSMANFEHPYAVRLLEASLDDPIGPCLVMEYVPGVTLEDLLARHQRLAPERVARLIACMCHALQAAHDAGIIHRDLKPANLMVMNADGPDETLKVMDFGFAGFAAKPHIQLAELTGHGPVHAMGTPAYVSPEMIRGDTVDTRSDLYSVGVILFELLTGRLPFNYNNTDKLLTAHVKEQPPRMHKIGCGFISPSVEGVVQLALSKYPNERQQSAREVAEAFDRAAGVGCWADAAPVGWEPLAAPAEVELPPVAPPAPASPFHVTHEFEALVPERMAAAKLRGFVEDYGGQVMESEPGMIRLRLGVPSGYKEARAGSGILGWLATRRPSVRRGQEPIELELQMEKPDPSQARLCVVVAFRPLKGYTPGNGALWRERCDRLNAILRQYLGA